VGGPVGAAEPENYGQEAQMRDIQWGDVRANWEMECRPWGMFYLDPGRGTASAPPTLTEVGGAELSE